MPDDFIGMCLSCLRSSELHTGAHAFTLKERETWFYRRWTSNGNKIRHLKKENDENRGIKVRENIVERELKRRLRWSTPVVATILFNILKNRLDSCYNNKIRVNNWSRWKSKLGELGEKRHLKPILMIISAFFSPFFLILILFLLSDHKYERVQNSSEVGEIPKLMDSIYTIILDIWTLTSDTVFFPCFLS